jgi:hypothetical protein
MNVKHCLITRNVLIFEWLVHKHTGKESEIRYSLVGSDGVSRVPTAAVSEYQ